MGALCCCFHAPDAPETVESSTSNHSFNFIIQNLRNKYGRIFGRLEMARHPSACFQGPESSSSAVEPDNMHSNTGIYSTNAIGSRYLQIRHDSVGMGHARNAGCSYLGLALPRKCNNVQTAESQEFNLESYEKVFMYKVESRAGYVDSASEDEDVCPTCLEEYTVENPKIVTKCCHHYHLGCIYEWMKRSETCPICGKLMEFNEAC
ncbi:E3 ubiquitin-protein ligase At3g02290 [Diospyros lotus]|uniref:E3 ubiquitin-protein ligase At3g02290 n=1 Tax=Diospyros lotus TaxID=55363 RepID=UPI00225B60B8|nr:E3 ubiquitin-protein ligase At3g02290 [Diospyros lotus]